ncbi:Fe-S cluster assembly protein SufD [Litorimonas taeanensis]|uniref:Fe-S cluster assembly protein SufD n=2 Tax=Litorimonas taeanensis TaxID=568099 RepID=A0A420WJS8_9PROT|nr:Fe-S cluster assembly protein SufD [Litorimonas taeanensis]
MPLKLDTLPTRRDEHWKWTDVRGRVTDGQKGLSVSGLPKFTLPDGVSVSESAVDEDDTNSPMAALARRFGGQVWTVDVPEGAAPQEPIVIEGFERGHVRIRLNIGKGAVVSVVEHYAAEDGAFCNADITINLGKGAELSRVQMQTDPADAVRVATTHVTAWGKAKLTQHMLGFGASLARFESRIAVMGTHCELTANGAYLLDDKRHIDLTSYIDLTTPDTLVRQAVKGVVTDKSRGVFQGKFHVRRPAQHTDAEMRHDALMLSDTAEIRSKPELEIYADDVACAHGNTIGALDESALFYMRQRGIPLKQARALLTEAFVAEAFDDLADEDLRESLLEKVRYWLETSQ